ncbi:MAG: glycoside hydrolase family 20 zincin-like fold domain-containing protein [bacterium]|nr:glycoside hydrolase family 20 zincin-like fold domain-containing protein [bacterium]
MRGSEGATPRLSRWPNRRRRALPGLLAAALGIAIAAQPAPSQPWAAGAWPDAYVTPPRDARIIPLPKSLRRLDAPFEITPATRIVVGDAAGPEDLYAARELNEEIAAWGAPLLAVVRASAAGDQARLGGGLGSGGWGSGGVILLGEPALNPLADAALAEHRISVDLRDLGPEGYALRVGPGVVVASGADRRGTFYAVQTLRQLVERDPRNPGRLIIRGASVRDWPDHPIRAVHVVLDSHSDVFHTALIDRIFSRYKFNVLIAESEYVRWESAPNIWHPGGATTAQAAAVIAAAREHLIEPIPLIQTLGHVGWLFHNDQNLDLMEMPPELAPARFAYDPLNPRVYEVVLPVLDEAIALFRPRLLHIGHDEVRNVVPFPWSEEGRRLGFGELFVRDTLRLYDHLKARGVGTMMWGDVLLTNEFAPEMSRLPRDIVMVDWQYHAAARYPSLDRFRAWGFPVLAATWYRHDNIASLSRDARRAGVSGMVRTTWTGYFGNRGALVSSYQQIYGYLPAADHFWNAGRDGPSLDAVEAASRFREEWRAARVEPQTIPGRALDIRAVANRSHIDRGHIDGGPDDDGAGWLGKGPDYDLRNLPVGQARFAGVLFNVVDPADRGGRSIVLLRGAREPFLAMPERVTIGAGFPAGALCFLHALPYPASRFGETVATYRVRFGDGGAAEIPIRYRVNIGTWLDEPIAFEHEIGWAGSTRSGVDVRISLFCWTNPDAGRPIVAVDLQAAGAGIAPAVFAITALDRARGAAGR